MQSAGRLGKQLKQGTQVLMRKLWEELLWNAQMQI